MQTYRSGHNGADSKSVCGQPHVSSNLTVCAKKKTIARAIVFFNDIHPDGWVIYLRYDIRFQRMIYAFGILWNEFYNMKNEAHLRCVKNEARLRRMKNEAHLRRMKNEALYFMAA